MLAEAMTNEMTIKEAAARLGVSTRTVWNWIKQGHLPGAFKRNPFASRRSEWLIPESDIERVERIRREGYTRD